MYAAESEAIKKRLFLLKTRPVRILLVAAILVAVFILPMNVLHWNSRLFDLLIFLYGTALILFGLPISILISRDAIKEARILKRDLEIGRVYIFEGVVAETWKSRKLFRGLLKERLIPIEAGALQRFDILPASGMVIEANGMRPRGWWKGMAFEATAPPEHHYDALVSGPDGDIGGQAELYQRHMSQGEITELAYHIARAKRPPAILYLLASLLLLMIAAISGYGPEGRLREWYDAFHLQAFLVGGSFAFIVRRYIQTLRTARLMAQDAGLKILRIIRPKPEFENRDVPVLELLPVSLLGWNMGGKPYAWRLRKTKS
jgi:hypothetical protein